MTTLSSISRLLVYLILLMCFRSIIGFPNCNPGYYYSGADCGTPTKSPAYPGTTWVLEIDTTEKFVYIRNEGDNTAGIYRAPYISAEDTYVVFTFSNTGTITFDRPSTFYQNQHVSTVTFGEYDVSFSGSGAVWGKSLASSGVTSFKMTFTSVAGWVCFGIDETTTFSLTSSLFTDKNGPCASSTGVTTHNITLICNGCTAAPCDTGYYLQPDSIDCLTTCPVGYYPDDSTFSCKPCHSYCSQCTGSSNTQCSACKISYFLQPSSTTCLDSCPTGYFPDTTNNACSQCHTICSQCTGSGNTQCQACKSGYFLQVGSTLCLDYCPSPYIADSINNICQQCDAACSQCTGPSSTECSACSSGYFLQPSSTSCKNTCPEGYYRNSTLNTCSACDSTCKTCSSYTNISCLTCYPTAYFYQNQCFTECPSHTFPVESDMTCADCSISCAECNGPSNNNCTVCTAGLYLYNSACNYICPQGTYANPLTSTCDPCDQTCKTCSGPTSTSCTSCNTTSSTPYYYQFTCSTHCPNGTYPDSDTFTCKNCHASCATCTSPLNTSCTSCKSTLYYNPDQRVCVSSCISPYTAVAATRTCEMSQQADASTLSQTLQALIDQMLSSPPSSSSNATALQDSGSFLNNLANTVSNFQNANFEVGDPSQQQQQCLDSCNDNGICQYQEEYLQYQCQCSSGWTGPSCATSTSDQSAIEAISLKIINTMSSVPLSLTMGSTWSQSYLESLLVLSNSLFSTISVTKQALSIIKNVVDTDFTSKTSSDIFDPVKMTIAAQVLDNCLQYVFKTDCYIQTQDSQAIYNDVLQIIEKLGVLNLWQKPADSGNYSLHTTDFELYSERVSPQKLSSHTIAQPNQARIVLQSGSSTSTSSTTPVDIQILFWKNNLMACPLTQKENSQPPLVSMAINEKDTTTQSAYSSTVSAQIAYPAQPNQQYTNCSSSSCTMDTTKDGSGATFYQCNCPNLNSMSATAQKQQQLFSNFAKLANAAALLNFDFLSSWVFWIIWAQIVWFFLTAFAIRARIIRPFTFRTKRRATKVSVKGENQSAMPTNLRNFKLNMGICKSLFYGLKYGHVFTSLYLYEDGSFPRFRRLVLLYTRLLILMAFSSLFKNTDGDDGEAGETSFKQTLMVLFLPVITITPINFIFRTLLITQIKSKKFIEHMTKKNPKLREEQFKKQLRRKQIAKIKAIIGYILVLCAVGGCNYIALVIAATTDKEQTTKWAISFLISLAQDMGTSQVLKVVVTVLLIRIIARGQSKKMVKILRLGLDPIVVRALAMVSISK